MMRFGTLNIILFTSHLPYIFAADIFGFVKLQIKTLYITECRILFILYFYIKLQIQKYLYKLLMIEYREPTLHEPDSN